MMRANGKALPLLLAGFLFAVRAHAEPTPQDRAAAESLFGEGRDLMQRRDFSRACPKFAESQRLDPAVGTLLNLAVCYESNGQSASAWAVYVEAASAAARNGQHAREKAARAKVAEIGPKLVRLRIDAHAMEGLPEAQVTRDGTALGRGSWGTAVPVDPGKHVVRATAKGRRPWSSEVDARKPGATVSITIPLLEEAERDAPAASSTASSGNVSDKPAASSTPASPAPESSRGDAQRILGLGLGGVGLVGIALGAVFGLRARSKEADARDHCLPENRSLCDKQGVLLNDEAKSAATFSTIGFVAGGTLAASAIVIYLTAPSRENEPPRASIHFAPVAGHSGAVGWIQGVW